MAKLESNAAGSSGYGASGSNNYGQTTVFDPTSNQVYSSPVPSTFQRLDQFLDGAVPEDFSWGFNSSVEPGAYYTIGEDCASHIAVSIYQNSYSKAPLNELVFTDLGNAAFASTNGRSVWSAPSQTVAFSEFNLLSFGAIVASGNHLGIIEDYDNEQGIPARFGAILLSPENGVADCAVFQTLPNATAFSSGYLNTYTSPNDGKDYAVEMFAPGTSSADVWFVLGVIDLKAALAAPRLAGTHLIQAGYDVVKNGVVRYLNVPLASMQPTP